MDIIKIRNITILWAFFGLLLPVMGGALSLYLLYGGEFEHSQGIPDIGHMVLYTSVLLTFNACGMLAIRYIGKKRAAYLLAQSNLQSENIALMLEESVNEIYIIDAKNLHFLLVNRGGRENLGYTLEELRQLTPMDIKPEITLEAFRKRVEPLFKGEKKKVSFDALHRRKDGTTYHAEVHMQKAHYDGNDVLFQIVLDVTEAKYTEQKIKEESTRIATVMDTVLDSIITIDDQGNIESMNQAGERMFGYRQEEVTGKNVTILMPDNYRDMHAGYIKHYLETGEKKMIGTNREVSAKRKNGSVFPMELAINEMNLNGARKFVGTLRDITERRQIIEALHRSEEQLYLAMTGMTDGMWDWNIKTGEIYSSFGFSHMLGYEESDMPSQMDRFVQLVYPTDRPVIRLKLIAHLKERTPFSVECRFLHKEGKYLWFNIRGQAIWDDDGQAITMTGFMTDISKQKALEQMKNDFVATVSHELRTPLTSIRGALGLLTNNEVALVPEKQEALMEIAYKNSERLMCLINDLLDIERMESGGMDLALLPLDIAPRIRQCLDINQAYAQKYQVNLVLQEPLPDIQVTLDSNRFIQAMTNLISNAIKFSPIGEEVMVACTVEGEHVKISVADKGAGIPETFRPYIFQRFCQASAGDEKHKGGSGLGLSITKSLTEHMGGSIYFDTEEGKGTMFYLEFPVSGEATSYQKSNDNLQGNLPYYASKILVCEDDDDVAHLIAYVLKETGIGADIAGSLATARELLSQERYAAITIDIHMPDGDGLDFLQEIENDATLALLPIIVISIEGKEAHLPHRNIKGWISKPIDINTLKETLHAALTLMDEKQLRKAIL